MMSPYAPNPRKIVVNGYKKMISTSRMMNAIATR